MSDDNHPTPMSSEQFAEMFMPLPPEVMESLASSDPALVTKDPSALAVEAVTKEMAIAPVKKCDIGQVLPASVVNLISVAPNNDTVRAVILAHLGKEVPATAVTFEDIRAWIESTFERKKSVLEQLMEAGQVPTPAARPPRPGILIPISGSEVESGRCRYIVTVSGNANYPISDGDLLEMANDAGDFEELVDLVETEIGDNWLDHIDLEPNDNGYNYNHHEADDSEDSDWSMDRDAARRIIREAMQRLAPERLQDL